MDKPDLLTSLLKDNPELRQLLDAYEDISRTYQAALEALGETETIELTVASSAELTLPPHNYQNTAINS